MDKWMFYTAFDESISTSLMEARRKAIEHLLSSEDRSSVPVYTSKTRKKTVGTVIRTDTYPLFVWEPTRGRTLPLMIDGRTIHKPL